MFVAIGLVVAGSLAWPAFRKPARASAVPTAPAPAPAVWPCGSAGACSPALAGDRLLQFVDEDLHARAVSLRSLAEPGAYTVVAFTSEHCGMSKWLESHYAAFIAARPDVVVKNVRVFSGSVMFTSKQEMAEWRARRDGVRKRFNLDWGPKVYVYGPDGTPIVGERSKGDEGYRYLRHWIKATVPGA
ncbi:MAG: hypothetical protein RI988_2589 [Pseudomonadota bacterium]|jgi:hypothetical protein